MRAGWLRERLHLPTQACTFGRALVSLGAMADSVSCAAPIGEACMRMGWPEDYLL